MSQNRDSATGAHDGLGYSKLARVLGDTIACKKAPFTVGVYGKWGTGKTQMLRLVRERLELLTNASRNNRSLSVNIFTLVYRLFFFDPIIEPPPKDTKIIFVDFSILDYAGSDKLWAGVITHISTTIDEIFGKWAVKIFRTWHYKPEIDLKPYLEPPKSYQKSTSSGWKLARMSSFIVPILVMLLVITAVVCFTMFGLPNFGDIGAGSDKDIVTTVVASVLGLGFAVKVVDVFKMVSNLALTQASKITSMSKKADFTTSLGFMAKVKKEIYYMTSVVQYMSVLLQYDIKICLIIDDVDLLGKEKIMSLFKVVSLLQNSRCSRYVQILCMDPMIAANLIKKALCRELSSNVNGHAFLRRNIQLPFHIPSFDDRIRSRLFLLKQESETVRQQTISTKKEKSSGHYSTEMTSLLSVVASAEEPLPKRPLNRKLERYNETRREVLHCFQNSIYLKRFNQGNERSVDRVLISTQFALRLYQSKQCKPIGPRVDTEAIAAWITLADQWPYRLSWIWQAIDDNAQNHTLDPQATIKFAGCSPLSDIYNLVAAKLTHPENWRSLLELDGDPETFVQMLKTFRFTIDQMNSFLPITTDLNRSIRGIICNAASECLVKQTSSLFDGCRSRWKFMEPVERWTVEDVCEELEKIGINTRNIEKYKELIHEKEINGQVLCECTREEMRTEFSMTLGDWAVMKKYLGALKTYHGLNRRSIMVDDLENETLT
uniref:NTPase KAP family P-loop domain-containing protein 1-like n=1 Tax=Ciona intestinalis TaxID=7719 RepID=UPI000180C434|nr:NTPase KAP family P-loop domain-containing protein 1-like [Ciona intestinalis]|eukprot:XP_002125032.1 NTPase KAP family P-loop domain-containing protein 1-like [Ciona intestinalis]